MPTQGIDTYLLNRERSLNGNIGTSQTVTLPCFLIWFAIELVNQSAR